MYSMVGGKRCLYNESSGFGIAPTPVTGLVGGPDWLDRSTPEVTLLEDHRLVLIGSTQVGLGGTQWGEASGPSGGEPIGLDQDLHFQLTDLVRHLVLSGLVGGANALSSGGLGMALAEMAIRAGVGLHIARVADHHALFGEGSSRVVVAARPDNLPEVVLAAKEAGVSVTRLGMATGDRFVVKGLIDLPLTVLMTAYAGRLTGASGVDT